MALEDSIVGLVDNNLNPIEDMNGDWVSYPYEFGENTHLCVHLQWSNPAITGVVYLEYSGDYSRNPAAWSAFNAINLDGTESSLMFLDSNLAVARFRIRYQRISGNATLIGFITRKIR